MVNLKLTGKHCFTKLGLKYLFLIKLVLCCVFVLKWDGKVL